MLSSLKKTVQRFTLATLSAVIFIDGSVAAPPSPGSILQHTLPAQKPPETPPQLFIQPPSATEPVAAPEGFKLKVNGF